MHQAAGTPPRQLRRKHSRSPALEQHAHTPEAITCAQDIAVHKSGPPHTPDNERHQQARAHKASSTSTSLEWLRVLLVSGAVAHTCILQLSRMPAAAGAVHYGPKQTTDYATRVSFSFWDSLLQACVYGLLFWLKGTLHRLPSAAWTPGSIWDSEQQTLVASGQHGS